VVADVRQTSAERVAAEIEQLGVRSLGIGCDVTRLADVEAVAAAAFALTGEVQILVNNAGVAVRPFRAIWDTTIPDYQFMINTNIWGLIHAIHTFVPRMRLQSGDKHIVNTGSMSAVWRVPGNAVYSMTKSAVDSLSTVMRDELEDDDFGVTILVPGLVNTTAAAETGALRNPAEQEIDKKVRPYSDYLEKQGKGIDVGAGRGRVHLIGAGKPSPAIEPECVGPMVIKAIKENRPYCFTHPAPVPAIMDKAQAMLEGYDP
jgi:NAD(P)-dependent dehydrogenase (short-subunit alcohol dehydrogenase family)